VEEGLGQRLRRSVAAGNGRVAAGKEMLGR